MCISIGHVLPAKSEVIKSHLSVGVQASHILNANMQQTTAYNLELARLERCIKQNICCLVSKKDPLRSNVDRTYYFNVFLPIYKFYTKYIHAALKYLPFYVFTLHLNLMIFIFF